MTPSAPSPDALVEQILRADRYRQSPRKGWHRLKLSRDTSLLCTYCGRAFDPCDTSLAVLSHLVPVELGGPSIDVNRVPSCRSCSKLKGTGDVLSMVPALSPDTVSAVSIPRLEILKLSANHLTNTRAYAPLEQVLDCLVQRWQHPRFRVYAGHSGETSWLAWTPRCGDPASLSMAMGLLRHGYGAQLQVHGTVSLLSMETPLFLDAVWELIELHALVQRVDVAGFDAPSLTDDWRTHWSVHLDKLANLRRRRNAMTERAPFQRVASGRPDALRKRVQRDAHKRVGALENWRLARIELDDFKGRVAAGQAQNPSSIEWLEMEREVLDLYERVIRASGPLGPGSVGQCRGLVRAS